MGHLGSVIVLLLLVGGVVAIESQIFADYIVDENQSFNNRSTLISVSINVYHMSILHMSVRHDTLIWSLEVVSSWFYGSQFNRCSLLKIIMFHIKLIYLNPNRSVVVIKSTGNCQVTLVITIRISQTEPQSFHR